MTIQFNLYFFYCICSKTALSSSIEPIQRKPLVISSAKFSDHFSRAFHPECPDRIINCETMLSKLEATNLIVRTIPSSQNDHDRRDKALEIVRIVHDTAYVDEVEYLCKKGARILSPWDEDTYISRNSFDVILLAQSAWMDGIDEVVKNKNMAFALTRPPGHHATKGASMGFCIFNLAAGAASYAMKEYKLDRIGIIDIDVHYGNGVADFVAAHPNMRYTSLHQVELFPNTGSPDYHDPHDNILNIPLPPGCAWPQYEPLLRDHAIPYLCEFHPDLVIVCAGYDTMASDELAQTNLVTADYGCISKLFKDAFGPVLFGLEGGYNVDDLPAAVEATILPYTKY